MLARYLYTAIFYLLVPLLLLRLLWRARKSPAYARRWRERFGFVVAVSQRPRIWLHVVSVGEALAAVPLVKQLLLQHPQHQLFITTGTPTGSERVRIMYADEARVEHCYAPFDLPDCLARFLERIQPQLLIVMETELWPNTIAACHARKIPVVIANARLSAKSAAGYRRFAALTKPMLNRLHCVAAQNTIDGQHFLELGLAPEKLTVTGSIKFDLQLSTAQRVEAASLKRRWSQAGRRLIWLVASTHKGEDELILQAFTQIKKNHPSLLLILIPRHPERFQRVYELCQQYAFQVKRRSEGSAAEEVTDILLGDTMGEQLLLLGCCDIAFVGGSLVPVGGHNLIEPAAWSLPILSGPELHNFAEVARLLSEAGALTIVSDSSSLAQAMVALLDNAETRTRMGAAAQQVAEANRGALARLLMLIKSALK